MISKVIPDYAKSFKKEYLFLLHVNDKIKYFIDNIKEATCGLFNNPKVHELKKIIEDFYHEIITSNFKELRNFEIKSDDILNLVTFKKILNDFIRITNYRRIYYQNFVNPFPGFENIYHDFELFCSKFKINYEDNEYLKCFDIDDIDDLGDIDIDFNKDFYIYI